MKYFSHLALTALLLCSPMVLLPTGRVHGADEIWEDILEFLGLMHFSDPKYDDAEITTGGHDLAPTARQGPEGRSSFTLDSFATGSDRNGFDGEPLDTYQTPEPSTLLLYVAGTAAAAGLGRMRRRRKSGSSA